MKRIFAIIAAALMLLSLCACDLPTPFIDIEKYKTSSHSSSDHKTDDAEKPEEEIIPNPEEFGVKIATQDISLSNDSGSRKIDLKYDLISVPDSNESYKKINSAAKADFEKFKKISAIAPDHLDNSRSFYNVYTAQITNTSNGILSVKYKTDWYMGGIKNTDYYGLNFSLKSGKPLKLGDMTDDPSKVLKAVKSKVSSHVKSSGFETYSNWEYDLEIMKLEDFDFYVEGNKITVCIPSYSLAHQSAGAMNIITDLTVDSNGKIK